MLLLFFGGAAGPVNYTLTCASGSYTYTGQAATFKRGYSLTCAAGAYTYTGQAATLKRGYSLTCGAGNYSYAGQDATLTYVAGVALLAKHRGYLRNVGR